MTEPDTHFARGPGGRIAYQVVGDGPLDLVFGPEAPRVIDVMWDSPRIAHMLGSLASFCRLICFDMRGFGVSDQVDISALPPTESWIDDILTVMDAVGSEQAAILAHGLQGPIAQLFAATHPDRVAALILVDSFARFIRDADYPCGMPRSQISKLVREAGERWGTGEALEYSSPALSSDPEARRWHAKFERLSMNPNLAEHLLAHWTQLDCRLVLPNILVPTLVVHHIGDRFIRAGHGKYLAEHIPDARYVELPGGDHVWYAGDTDAVVDEVRKFLTGERYQPVENRLLATIVFVDIVDSTRHAAELGDSRWREQLQTFQTVVRGTVERHRGHEVDTAGDGYFARFDIPTRAVRCAREIGEVVRDLGLALRTGVHTGECELMGDGKVGGIAVHIGARVASLAQADEVLVTSTVKDLTGGSGLTFQSRGTHALKGVPDEWPLFAAR